MPIRRRKPARSRPWFDLLPLAVVMLPLVHAALRPPQS